MAAFRCCASTARCAGGASTTRPWRWWTEPWAWCRRAPAPRRRPWRPPLRVARAPGTLRVLHGHARGAIDVKHEEFAERAVRRLEAVADWLEGEGKRLGIGLGIDGEASKTKAR